MSQFTFPLPDVGEGLTEAEIVSWRVKPGDEVAVNQVVCEIETAKSLVELPSPFQGVVKELLVNEGDTVLVGTPIISVEGEGGDSAPDTGVTDAVGDAESSVTQETKEPGWLWHRPHDSYLAAQAGSAASGCSCCHPGACGRNRSSSGGVGAGDREAPDSQVGKRLGCRPGFRHRQRNWRRDSPRRRYPSRRPGHGLPKPCNPGMA